MKRSFRRTRVLGAALSAALLAAGCSSGQSSSVSFHIEKRDLVVAAVPALDSAALYIAQERGFFAQEGLNVKIVPATSGETVIAGQEKGQYDVTLGNYVSYFAADRLHHGDFRILAAASIMTPRTQELLVPADSTIASMHQLAGQNVGVNAKGNIGTLLIGSLLTDNLMKPDQINYVAKPFPVMVSELAKHKVAAAWLPEPFISVAELTIGARELQDMSTGSTGNLPIAGYMVTQHWLNQYPGTARAFYAAIEKAQAIASQNLQAVREGAYKYALLPFMPKASALTVSRIATVPDYPLVTDPRVLQRVANLMLQFSMVNSAINVKSLIVPFAKQ